MDDMEAEAAPMPEEGAAPEAQGYTIEIKVAADGSMTYCVEPGAEEAEEEGKEGDYNAVPVKGMADLMAKIKDTIANGGASQEDSNAQFKAGLGEDEGAPA